MAYGKTRIGAAYGFGRQAEPSRFTGGRALSGPRVARRGLPPPTVLVGKEDRDAARRSLEEHEGPDGQRERPSGRGSG
ncbi:hypothetical protein FB566_4182 [Stackebrandtia endophytica]|uniref:Uncharacterized protein n=1 Tax=Stackebrandtia endophytica TaxID=1496996 RepID=A0A543B181_9ACTN|nr:hypothetical protein FB566_4182 [Stackebrandtia endophytica]